MCTFLRLLLKINLYSVHERGRSLLLKPWRSPDIVTEFNQTCGPSKACHGFLSSSSYLLQEKDTAALTREISRRLRVPDPTAP